MADGAGGFVSEVDHKGVMGAQHAAPLGQDQLLANVRYEHIHIDGIVQGVGFRPFVYRLAKRYGLRGWVRNSSQGVDIRALGNGSLLDDFAVSLSTEVPPLARITNIRRETLPPDGHDLPLDFVIVESKDESGFTLVSPDVATCKDCLRELFDPNDRRYRYPFINCTNCGPRFSIIQSLPYDRPNTTMRIFPMCDDCRGEYEDPMNRRFHAQPNACPACGPEVWLEVKPAWKSIVPQDAVDDIARAAALLRNGAILAIKGLGGFHLACDATNQAAVAKLRERKTRPHKPLAVMAQNLDAVRECCVLSAEEESLLTSPAAPVLLLMPKLGHNIAPNVAPGQRTIGVMLPYTPLHHILLRDAGRPLVMTSGNRQDEPIARTNEEAREKLDSIVDGYLWHNRPIYNRIDDSVWIPSQVGAFPIRRSRGYVPYPIMLNFESPETVLAVGSQMKNTFCLLDSHYAFLSQHIGEMDYLGTWQFFSESAGRFMNLFRLHPSVVAYDMHPDFGETAEAALASLPGLEDARRVQIQHHHAHIASCLAENGVAGPVIGLAFDGTGYGSDGTIWGGEFLLADLRGYERIGHISTFPLPGGDTAIRNPYRTALALLHRAFGDVPEEVNFWKRVPEVERNLILAQAEKGLNAPLTSSCGRLFDAVSAMLEICSDSTYEGQAAIELEAQAARVKHVEPYFVEPKMDAFGTLLLPAETVFRIVTEDFVAGMPAAVVAARFHRTMVELSLMAVEMLSRKYGVREIVLSGGCFQNRILLEGLAGGLKRRGFKVYTHHNVPPGDGGISLGQAVVASIRH